MRRAEQYGPGGSNGDRCEFKLTPLKAPELEENQEHMQFHIDQGMTEGTSRRLVRDIYEWIPDVKMDLSPERIC